MPAFRPTEFDAGPKTILGRTRPFDARSAVRWLASHEATARRFGRLLMACLGVENHDAALETRLLATYRTTGGSIEALLREIVRSDAFWSESSRWAGHLDFVHDDGRLWEAIFVAQPDFFRLNYVEADTDTARPTMFATTANTPGTVIVMQR